MTTRRWVRAIGAGAGLAAMMGAGAQAQECGRACLEGLVEDYLQALAANDPSRLPLTDDVRFTENGVELELGDALWRTATGLGTYRHVFVDPEMGQVGAYVTVRENGEPATLVLRLKREDDGAISEIETLVVRGARPATRVEEAGYPLPLWTSTIPEEERLTRMELVRAANSYFSAIENQDGEGVYAFGEECNRMENSTYTTNAGGTSFEASLDDAPTMAELNIQALGCREQFETGNFAIDTEIHDRRFPVVDIERGTVFAFGFFDHDAKMTQTNFADGSTKPSDPALWTWRLGEAFKIEKGLITQVEAWILETQYHSKTGWDNFGRDYYGIVDAGGVGK